MTKQIIQSCVNFASGKIRSHPVDPEMIKCVKTFPQGNTRGFPLTSEFFTLWQMLDFVLLYNIYNKVLVSVECVYVQDSKGIFEEASYNNYKFLKGGITWIYKNVM